MPDLTIEAAWTCETNLFWETQVRSSRGGGEYTVRWEELDPPLAEKIGAMYGWTCTCEGFRFRATCKHVEGIEQSGQRCGWNQSLEPTLQCERDEEDEPMCPECGGPVTPMRVAV